MLTQNELVTTVAMQLADYASGAVNNRSATSVASTALIGSAKSLKGLQIVIATNAPSTLYARITAYDDITGTITFSPALSTGPTWLTFEVYPHPRDSIVHAVNRAIKAAGDNIMASETVELNVDTQGQAALPADFVLINSVDVRVSVPGEIPNWEPITAYEVQGDTGSRTLILREYPRSYAPGAILPVLRVGYVRLAKLPAAGTDDLSLDVNVERTAAEVITQIALSYIYQRMAQINPGSEASRMYLTLMRESGDKAEKERRRLRPPLVGVRVSRPARARYN